MKHLLYTLLQFVVFLLVFAAGSFAVPLHLRQVLSVTSAGTRIFIWDGVALMLALYILILLVQAARRTLPRAAPWTTLALLLAAAAGFALKLGFLTA